jgi:TfoX/Sxy family transcriptional regulator of competence genes
MAYNESLAEKLRLNLRTKMSVKEKKMMGGLCIMVDEKMCVGIIKDEIMLRVNPELVDTLIEKQGCRLMDFTKRPMKGYIYIDETAFSTNKELQQWIQCALDYNPTAKSSKKK